MMSFLLLCEVRPYEKTWRINYLNITSFQVSETDVRDVVVFALLKFQNAPTKIPNVKVERFAVQNGKYWSAVASLVLPEFVSKSKFTTLRIFCDALF